MPVQRIWSVICSKSVVATVSVVGTVGFDRQLVAARPTTEAPDRAKARFRDDATIVDGGASD
jgi:hypothetical protein